MPKLQVILISVSTVIGITAVLMFAGILPGWDGGGGKTGPTQQVTMWGIFDGSEMRSFVSDFNSRSEGIVRVKYSSKRRDNYEQDVINALASGAGPDIWILDQETLLRNVDKIFPIPFSSYPERTYVDTFVDSTDIFLDRRGETIAGLPFVIDPMLLYWNRNSFSSASISAPPAYWDEFLSSVVPSLTKIDNAGNIVRSGVAMGGFGNIKNAKNILSMLIMQGGDPVVKSGYDNPKVLLGQKSLVGGIEPPAESALRFYNEFSNPSKASYSWNKSLDDSDVMFGNSSSAMYFGYASEYEDMKKKNPHLAFDITSVPQIRDGDIRATHGKIYILVISKNSQNKQATFSAIARMTSERFSEEISKKLRLGSPRRDVLGIGSDDPILSVVYKSSVMARSWLEPDPQKTDNIFRNMIEWSATGRKRISEAVRDANTRLEALLK